MGDETLFYCEAPLKALKAVMDACSPICKQVHLVLTEEHGIHFHAIEDGHNVSVEGRVTGEVNAMGPGAQVAVVIKDFVRRINAYDPKQPLLIEVRGQGKRTVLHLLQGELRNTVTVEATDTGPLRPTNKVKGATATLDSKSLFRAMHSLKERTDAVTVEVKQDVLALTYASTRSREDWSCPSATKGTASGLFGSVFLHGLLQGAAKCGKQVTLLVGDEQPLVATAAGDLLEAKFHLANRSPMS